MSNKNKGIISRIISITLAASMLTSNIPVYAASDDYKNIDLTINRHPLVDIVLTVGRTNKTNIDVENFERDITETLRGMDVDVNKILEVSSIETSQVDMENAFDWDTSSYTSSSIGKITIGNNGQTVTMVGNPSLQGKNAIYCTSNSDVQQIFNFDYNIAFGDSFNAAGMLLRLNDTGSALTGYMISFNNTGAFSGSTGSIWKFTFQKGTNSTPFASGSTIQKVQNLSLSRSGNLTVTADSEYITVAGGGLSSPVSVKVEGETQSGFGFFSDHYSHGCNSIGNFTLQNITLQEVTLQHFSDILAAPEWREDSVRVVVNVNDYLEEDFKDPEKLADILSRCYNEQINYVGWGPNDIKQDSLTFIEQNDGNGAFVEIANASSYDSAISETASYIKSFLPEQDYFGQEYMLVGGVVDIGISPEQYASNTATTDYPDGRWAIVHDIKSVDVPAGQYKDTGIYKDTLDIETFSNPGMYQIMFEDEVLKEIYVHRKPEANFNISFNLNTKEIDIENTSYDLDKYNTDTGNGPGIQDVEWKYKKATDSSWTDGIPEDIEERTTYIVSLRVQDFQGQWSDVKTKYVSTVDEPLPPVADFTMSASEISKYGDVDIINQSYDPKGLPITEYTWEIIKNDRVIYSKSSSSFFEPSGINFISNGTGTYIYKLKVKNSNNMYSEAYTKYLSVIEDERAPEIIANPQTGDWAGEHIVSINLADIDSKLNSASYSISDSKTDASEWISLGTVSGLSEFNTSLTIDEPTIKYLHIRAIDKAGNQTEIVRGPYHIDGFKPEITGHEFELLSISPFSIITNKDVLVTVNIEEPHSGLDYIEYKLPGKDWEKGIENTPQFLVMENVESPIEVRAYDKAGNVSDVYLIENLIIENVRPELNIEVDSSISNDKVVVTVDAYDKNGISSIVWQTSEGDGDNIQMGTIEGDNLPFDITLENEGEYAFTATVYDKAGNSNTTESVIIRIDKTSPEIERTYFSGNNIAVEAKDYGIYSSGVNYVEYSKDGKTWEEDSRVYINKNNNYLIPVLFGIDNEIFIRAVDKAGNISEIEKVKIPENSTTSMPELEITISSFDTWTNKEVEFAVNAYDNDGLISLKTDINGDIVNSVNNIGDKDASYSYVFTDEGVYEINISVTDMLVNTIETSRIVRIDKTPLEITDVDTEISSSNGNRIKVTVEYNDNLSGLGNFEYRTKDSQEWIKVSPGASSFYINTSYNDTIEIRGYDKAGNISEVFETEKIYVVEEPVVNISNPVSWGNGSQKVEISSPDWDEVESITVIYTKPDGEEVRVNIPKEDSEFEFNESGEYDVTFEIVKENGDTDTVERHIKVDGTELFKAPNVELGGYVPGEISHSPIDIELSYDDKDIPESGILRYEYKDPITGQWIEGLPSLDKNTDEEYIFRAVSNSGEISKETDPIHIKIVLNSNYVFSLYKNSIEKDEELVLISNKEISEDDIISEGNIYIYKSDGNEFNNYIAKFDSLSDGISFDGNKVIIDTNEILTPGKRYFIEIEDEFIRTSLGSEKLEFVCVGNGSWEESDDNELPLYDNDSVPSVSDKDGDSLPVLDNENNDYIIFIPPDYSGEIKIEKDNIDEVECEDEEVSLTDKDDDYIIVDIKNNPENTENPSITIYDKNGNEETYEIVRQEVNINVDIDQYAPINDIIIDINNIELGDILDGAYKAEISISVYPDNDNIYSYVEDFIRSELGEDIDEIEKGVIVEGEIITYDNDGNVLKTENINNFKKPIQMEIITDNPLDDYIVFTSKDNDSHIVNRLERDDNIKLNVDSSGVIHVASPGFYYEGSWDDDDNENWIENIEEPEESDVNRPITVIVIPPNDIIWSNTSKLPELIPTYNGNREYYNPSINNNQNKDMTGVTDNAVIKDLYCAVPMNVNNQSVISTYSYANISTGMFKFTKPIDGQYALIRNHKDYADLTFEWCYGAIHALTSREIVSGYNDNTFRADNKITRAEFAAIIARLEGLPIGMSDNKTYDDVDYDKWYYPYIEAVTEYGYMIGYNNNEFGPDDLITREQIATALYRLMTYKGIVLKQTQGSFSDMSSVSEYATIPVTSFNGSGIINGYPDGTFRAKDSATRAEVCQMIWNIIRKVVDSNIKQVSELPF